MIKNACCLLACLVVAPVAHAELTATFVQDPVTFAGRMHPVLQVTTDTDWLTGMIDIQLYSGRLIYYSGGFPPGPHPQLVSVDDSGVFGPNFAAPPRIEPGWVATADEFTASWSTLSTDEIGTFYIGAFWFSYDANGTIIGQVTALNPNDPLEPFVFDLEGWSVVNGVVTHTAEEVPEPSTVGLSALALMGMISFARRNRWYS